jgi:hypothetical protein
MRLKVDEQADALYLNLSEAPASRSEEVAPGIRGLRRPGSCGGHRDALPFETCVDDGCPSAVV